MEIMVLQIGDIDFDRTVNNTTFNMEDKDGTHKTISIKNTMRLNIKYECNETNKIFY